MADAGRSSLRFDLSDSEIERRSGHSSGSYPGNGSSPALSPRRASSPQGPGPGHSKQAATSSPTLANLNQPLSSRFSIGKGKDPAAKKVKDKKKGLGSSSSSPTQARICLNDISVEVLGEWETCLDALLKHPDGVELFENFLKSEFSEENIQFWKACERFRTLPEHMVEKEAFIVYEEYVAAQAPKLVNIDYQTSKDIMENMKTPSRTTFSRAQQSIYLLMARDSFVRFVKSEHFQQALKRLKR